MRMMLQLLSPGVQHAEEANIGSETLWVPGDLDQRLGAGAEQQIVDDFLVLQCQRSQFVRQGKDSSCEMLAVISRYCPWNRTAIEPSSRRSTRTLPPFIPAQTLLRAI